MSLKALQIVPVSNVRHDETNDLLERSRAGGRSAAAQLFTKADEQNALQGTARRR